MSEKLLRQAFFYLFSTASISPNTTMFSLHLECNDVHNSICFMEVCSSRQCNIIMHSVTYYQGSWCFDMQRVPHFKNKRAFFFGEVCGDEKTVNIIWKTETKRGVFPRPSAIIQVNTLHVCQIPKGIAWYEIFILTLTCI